MRRPTAWSTRYPRSSNAASRPGCRTPPPTRTGNLFQPKRSRPWDDEASTLTTTPSGQHVTVARVSDRDRAILDYLTEIGLLPGVSVHVQERLPFDGPLEIRIGDRIHHLGRSVSDRVFVLPDDSDAAASGSG